jgi:hypothetical protein
MPKMGVILEEKERSGPGTTWLDGFYTYAGLAQLMC